MMTCSLLFSITVVLEPESPAWLARMPALLSSVLETLGGLALALVLVVFMLLKREDMRNRLIRLVSHGQITVMTKALDDAGRRISRFLLMQLIVNATVGLSVGLGLLAIGVQYAFLWGFLVVVFRYIPYVGVFIAAWPDQDSERVTVRTGRRLHQTSAADD